MEVQMWVHLPVRRNPLLLQVVGGLIIAAALAIGLYLLLLGAFFLVLIAIPVAVLGLVLMRPRKPKAG